MKTSKTYFVCRLKKKIEHTWKSVITDGVSFAKFAKPSVFLLTFLILLSELVLPLLPNNKCLNFSSVNQGECFCVLILWIVCNIYMFICQDTVSVHRPAFYCERFQKFMSDNVFKRSGMYDNLQIHVCNRYTFSVTVLGYDFLVSIFDADLKHIDNFLFKLSYF